MAFSFDFAGDDIEVDQTSKQPAHEATKPSLAAGAFPVAGKPQLPPAQHSLGTLIAQLPSKIAFSYLDIHFDDGDGQEPIKIPRRELWDVRVQLMAEDDGRGGLEGLGEHDVKTGVYEGGFKSWESSVDLVKTLAATRDSWSGRSQGLLRIIEVLT
jgi:protein-histidine N-methyltransferase